MTDFTVTIDDPDLLEGITRARQVNGDYDTDAEYVQFVMSSAAESYANQHGVVLQRVLQDAVAANVVDADVALAQAFPNTVVVDRGVAIADPVK